METITPHLRNALRRAAMLRASNMSWEQVGLEIGRAADAVRRWPRKFPEEWAKQYSLAETMLYAEAGAEALYCIRALLRSKNERSVFAAGSLLLNVRLAERKRLAETTAVPTEEEALVADCVREMMGTSDEELNRYFDRVCDHRLAARVASRNDNDFDPAI